MTHLTHSFGQRSSYDLVLVGGGLQNGLIALACLQRDRSLRIAMVERGSALGGNHTWAIHADDVPEAARAFVEPIISARWTSYDVRFATLSRTLQSPYAAIRSERFARVVSEALARSPGSALWLGNGARAIDGPHVELEDGTRLRGALVVDARGPAAPLLDRDHGAARDDRRAAGGCGYQKFFGLELELAEDHGLVRPILMDATVEQIDGFRFFYVLPFGPRRLLIEDTVFSRSAVLDPAARRDAVLAYALRFGGAREVVREERGVLPMPWSTEAANAPSALSSALRSPLVAGYQGGFFHPATGYSFPVALRLACLLARLGPTRALGPELAAFVRAHEAQARFARQLNRLLFTGFAPETMHHVFERFYALPAELINRFYALQLSALDRARILVGRPPRGFSLARALAPSSVNP